MEIMKSKTWLRLMLQRAEKKGKVMARKRGKYAVTLWGWK